MEFKKFGYRTLEDLQMDVENMGLDLCFLQDVSILSEPVKVHGRVIPNSLAFHPMEGCDGELDGSPSGLVKRRYGRLAGGGAGLIWFEAVAVVREGRAYPRQLWINRENVSEFKKLFENIMSVARGTSGGDSTPLVIMQITHSGRFSKPDGKPAPVITVENPYIDRKYDLGSDWKIISDGELEELEEKFVKAAELAAEAGFHGVDVKACHRYLISELLSAHTRQGRYGGSFEGRTRFLINVMDKIRAKMGRDFIVTTRMNMYDGIPYPYGWGANREDFHRFDPAEPVRLAKLLYDRGTRILNTTMGSPYYNPHVNRPYDGGGYVPDEHPLEGIARLTGGTASIQKSLPDMAVIGTGYTWLRHLSPYLAAGMKKQGNLTLAGYGRQAFAYPGFPLDIIEKKAMDKGKCCIACGKCTEIMRAGGTAGCVVRDVEVYGPIYKKYVKGK